MDFVRQHHHHHLTTTNVSQPSSYEELADRTKGPGSVTPASRRRCRPWGQPRAARRAAADGNFRTWPFSNSDAGPSGPRCSVPRWGNHVGPVRHLPPELYQRYLDPACGLGGQPRLYSVSRTHRNLSDLYPSPTNTPNFTPLSTPKRILLLPAL